MEPSKNDYISIQGLSVDCIIGIFDWERTTLQKVIIDLEFPCDTRRASKTDRIEDTVDYKKISKKICAFVESSQYFLLETLAENVARFCIQTFGLSKIGVSASKPGAIKGAKNVSVTIERTLQDYSERERHSVFLSIGSNVQPEKFIAQTVRSIHALADVLRISQVYETTPFGGMNQPYYWNLAAEICTHLSEKDLKAELLRIEEESGRIRCADKSAPRTIDVDILIFDGRWNLEGHATTSYPLSERAFVLVPLAEVAPHLTDPQSGKKLIELLASRAYSDQSIKCLGSWMNTPVGIDCR